MIGHEAIAQQFAHAMVLLPRPRAGRGAALTRHIDHRGAGITDLEARPLLLAAGDGQEHVQPDKRLVVPTGRVHARQGHLGQQPPDQPRRRVALPFFRPKSKAFTLSSASALFLRAWRSCVETFSGLVAGFLVDCVDTGLALPILVGRSDCGIELLGVFFTQGRVARDTRELLHDLEYLGHGQAQILQGAGGLEHADIALALFGTGQVLDVRQRPLDIGGLVQFYPRRFPVFGDLVVFSRKGEQAGRTRETVTWCTGRSVGICVDEAKPAFFASASGIQASTQRMLDGSPEPSTQKQMLTATGCVLLRVFPRFKAMFCLQFCQ